MDYSMSEMFYATPNQMFTINKLTHLLSGIEGVPSASMPISKSDANDLIKDMVKVQELLGNPATEEPKKAKRLKKVKPNRDGEIKVIKISI